MTTLMQMKEIILEDFRDWYLRGMETGKWVQEGIIYLRGPAGVGKTEILYQISKELVKGYRDLPAIPQAKNLVQLFFNAAMDPESIAGTPAPTQMKIQRPNPDFNPDKPESDENPRYLEEIKRTLTMHYREELVRAQHGGPGALLFADEIGREAPHMRAAQLKLLSPEKTLSGLDMNNFYIVCAGNPSDEQHRVDDIMTDAAMASRLIPFDIQPSVTEWVDYMYDRGPTAREVANFLLDNTDMWVVGRDNPDNDTSPIHCPRSWTLAASRLHAHGGGTEKTPATLKSPASIGMVSGIVGEQACARLQAYMSRDRVMTLQAVLKGKFNIDPKTKRIRHNIPVSVVRSLQHYLEIEELTDTEAKNTVDFLKAIAADISHSINRENRRIKPENLAQLAAYGAFADTVRRTKNLDLAAKNEDNTGDTQ